MYGSLPPLQRFSNSIKVWIVECSCPEVFVPIDAPGNEPHYQCNSGLVAVVD